MGNIGQFSSVKFNIAEPLDMNDVDFTLNNLTLLCGANGSGKTFVLINVYALTGVANLITKGVGDGVVEGAQFIFDNCLSDQNIDGTISSVFTNNSTLEITFKEGKVVDVNHTGFENITDITPIKYMSSSMRLFSAMNQYLKVRKIFTNQGKENELLFNEMLGHYKLYDVAYIEGLIVSLPKRIHGTKLAELKDSFNIDENIIEFNVDLDKCEFYVNVDTTENRKYLSRYSNGHQAILNMFLGNL